MKKRETRAIKHLMSHLDYHLFSVPGSRHVVTALPHADSDSDNEDWGALDEEFEEPAISRCIGPLRHDQRDIPGASAVLCRARVTAISRAMTGTAAAAAAAVARRIPGGEHDLNGPDTPPTRLPTPEGLDLSFVSRIPRDAESISVSLSWVHFAASQSNNRQGPAADPALAAHAVPIALRAPLEQAAEVLDADAPTAAPRQRCGTAKAPKSVQPIPAPAADVAAVPDAQADNAPRQRRVAATKASKNVQPVLPVPLPGPRRKASNSGPSTDTPAGLAPVPDADTVKPKPKL